MATKTRKGRKLFQLMMDITDGFPVLTLLDKCRDFFESINKDYKRGKAYRFALFVVAELAEQDPDRLKELFFKFQNQHEK